MAVFLSRILWPPLLSAVYFLPVWFLCVALYLCFRPREWRVGSRRADGLADLRSGSLGLYMTVQESGDTRWENALCASPPRLDVRVPYGSLALFALIAAGAVFLASLPDLRSEPAGGAEPATPVERMEETVELLEEVELADEEYLEKTTELLRDLETQGQEGLDAEDWQALDEAREELKRQAGQRWEQRRTARQTLESLAGALQRGESLRSSQARELAEALSKLPRKEVNAALKRTANRTGIAQERLREILKNARKGRATTSRNECEALGQLAGQCRGGGKGPGREGIGALRRAGFSEKELKQILAPDETGEGGVTRGPGAAPLQYLGNTTEGGEFQARTFRGNEGELKAELGSAVAPPDEADETGGAEVSRGSARSFSTGSAGITWHSRLLPRHNEVLKKYFREQEDPRTK
jgi:hypothetical protein